MESIKHKMECLQREAVEAHKVKQKFLNDEENFSKQAIKYEKLILEVTKEINSEEEKLDQSLTEIKDTQVLLS